MRKITELFAWIVTDTDGEGLPAVEMTINGRRMMMPLVGADWLRVQSLQKYAHRMRAETGTPVRLCRFQLVEEIDEDDVDSTKRWASFPSRM
jgi:hypothetical protein